MSNQLLCIYPAILLFVLIFGAKVSKSREFIDDCWSLKDSKNLQIIASYSIILHHLTQLISQYGSVNVGLITIYADLGILFTSIFFFYIWSFIFHLST